MTRQEALIYLPLQEDEDPLDTLTEKLFDFKQFFLSKVVLHQTFNARIAKLKLIEEACGVLGVLVESEQNMIYTQPEFPENILQAYHLFQSEKSVLKVQMTKASTPGDIAQIALEMLKLNEHFQSCWPEIDECPEEVLISREPDPMDLLQAIKRSAQEGISTFSDLGLLKNDPSNMLLTEMKRISLQRKKEREWIASLKS